MFLSWEEYLGDKSGKKGSLILLYIFIYGMEPLPK